MLAKFEQWQFTDGIRMWYGIYRDLQNLIHWHTEYELIIWKQAVPELGSIKVPIWLIAVT